MGMHILLQLTLALDLAEQGVRHTKIAAHLGKHRETIGLWLKGIAVYGLSGFLKRHAQAKKGPRRARQVPARIQRLIRDLRAREYDCCGQTIAYVLEREPQVRLSVPKIYESLAEQYVICAQWCKNQHRGAGPKAACARAVIQMDTVAFGHLVAFTGVDIYTREADVLLRPTLTSDDGAAFLHTAMARRFTGRVEVLQTDGARRATGRLPGRPMTIANDIVVPVPTRKTNRPTVNVSLVPSARKAWAGERIELGTSRA